jgi:type IV secretion system protein VirD4
LAPATRSILCIDTKGDLARATARWRAEYLKQKVGILDPAGASGDVAKDYAVKLNPMNSLARCHEQRMVPAARLIADAIIVEGELPDPHWDITAGHFLSGLSVHVATYSAYKKFRDLVMVRDLIMQATRPDPHNPKRYKLESEMLANGAAGGFVAKAAMEFYDRAPGEFSSVLSNLRKHTEWIDYQFMSDTLRGDGIDLRDLKEKSLALYVVVRAGDMAALRGWQRLIIQLALAAHEETTEQYGPATLFIMDEFHNLSRMKQIESAAAQIAGFGCQLMPVLQDLSQLKALYPNSWETFAANSGVIQTFATADYTSCEYISKLLGSTPTVSHASHAPTFEQATKHAATGESWSIGSSPLLAPEEVMRFFARDDKLLRQLILRPGYRPIIAQRVFLDRHQLFTGKFDK